MSDAPDHPRQRITDVAGSPADVVSLLAYRVGQAEGAIERLTKIQEQQTMILASMPSQYVGRSEHENSKRDGLQVALVRASWINVICALAIAIAAIITLTGATH